MKKKTFWIILITVSLLYTALLLVTSPLLYAQDEQADLQTKLNQNIYTMLRLNAQKQLLDSQLQDYIKEYVRKVNLYDSQVGKLVKEKAALEGQIKKLQAERKDEPTKAGIKE